LKEEISKKNVAHRATHIEGVGSLVAATGGAYVSSENASVQIHTVGSAAGSDFPYRKSHTDGGHGRWYQRRKVLYASFRRCRSADGTLPRSGTVKVKAVRHGRRGEGVGFL